MSSRLSEAEIEAIASLLKHALLDFEIGEADASPTVRHRIEGAVIALDCVLGRGDDDLIETVTSEWSSSSRTWG